MLLTTEQFRAITQGVDRIAEENGGIGFHRFSKEQEAFYKNRSADLYMKTLAAAGVKLRFRTDSRTMRLAVLTEAGSSRSYFSIDVFVNGEKRDSLNNFEGVELPENYTLAELPLGEFEKTFDLGDGEKEVCLYLPWSVKTWIRELHLDDGAFVTAVKPKNVLLAFGDSITQGYDALYPSDMYITRFAEYLDAFLFNKAIGAEIFVPPLAQMEEWIIPDIITVAYGTNDWSKCGKAEFTENCKAFFKNLQATYPYADIVAITPIWREDADCTEKSCAFAEVEDIIRACTADIENVRVISGFDFVPQDTTLYADFRLHPNDEGFDYYYNGLVKAFEGRR